MTPSMATNKKKIIKVIPKLMIAETLFEKRNKYLGTLIFVKIDAFVSKDNIPPLVCSAIAGDNEKALLPHVHLQEKGINMPGTDLRISLRLCTGLYYSFDSINTYICQKLLTVLHP